MFNWYNTKGQVMPDTDQRVPSTYTIEERRKKRFFMICDTCFWCASSIEINLSKYPQAALCPMCKGTNIQLNPLALDIMHLTKMMQPKQQHLSAEVGFLA
jgi:hypothetical protein